MCTSWPHQSFPMLHWLFQNSQNQRLHDQSAMLLCACDITVCVCAENVLCGCTGAFANNISRAHSLTNHLKVHLFTVRSNQWQQPEKATKGWCCENDVFCSVMWNQGTFDDSQQEFPILKNSQAPVVTPCARRDRGPDDQHRSGMCTGDSAEHGKKR